VVVLELLGVVAWVVLGLVGVWFLVTGRRFIGLPASVREGWRLRALGLLWIVITGVLIDEALRGSYSPQGVAFTYVYIAAVVVVFLYRRRKVREFNSRVR
jgi:hypothetical protein